MNNVQNCDIFINTYHTYAQTYRSYWHKYQNFFIAHVTCTDHNSAEEPHFSITPGFHTRMPESPLFTESHANYWTHREAGPWHEISLHLGPLSLRSVTKTTHVYSHRLRFKINVVKK
jgi:hypothetical protein